MKLTMIFVSLIAFVGCVNSDNLASKLKKIGIDMENQSDDYCTRRQISTFIMGYDSLSKTEKQNFVDQLQKNVKEIKISPIKHDGNLQGSTSTLYYVERKCYNNDCWWERKAEKVLDSNVTNQKANFTSQLSLNGDILNISTSYQTDQVIKYIYYTKSVDTYDKVESLAVAQKHADVWKPEITVKDEEICAQSVSFKMLLTTLNITL